MAVASGSPADRSGVQPGDALTAVNGQPVRDVIEYRIASDGAEVWLSVDRGGLQLEVEINKSEGEPLGIEVESAVFDRVRTCDNHCEFCFIHQLPKGMRRSLYLKDDDYRLSFLYGNFTTLTRFTEADLERVITEGLSPLFVSIHATDPDIRAGILKNRRGAMSLRWLRALLDHGIEIHGQVVVCPGVNDGDVLDDTLCGVLDEYPELADVAVVPLGVSQFNRESRMRPHTVAEAAQVCDLVDGWQETFLTVLGHRMVFAADEYYLLAGREFPEAARYGDFDMHEDGIGMARAFELEFTGRTEHAIGTQPGFFAWVDGSPATGYRAPRGEPGLVAGEDASDVSSMTRTTSVAITTRRRSAAPAPIGILTGEYGAQVLGPLVAGLGRSDVRLVPVKNRFFGGNTAVAGLMVGEDVAATLAGEPGGHRYLLPDVCLSQGRFLDGLTVDDLPVAVEVIPTDGLSLRRAIDSSHR